jgi:hypothetical protein
VDNTHFVKPERRLRLQRGAYLLGPWKLLQKLAKLWTHSFVWWSCAALVVPLGLLHTWTGSLELDRVSRMQMWQQGHNHHFTTVSPLRSKELVETKKSSFHGFKRKAGGSIDTDACMPKVVDSSSWHSAARVSLAPTPDLLHSFRLRSTLDSGMAHEQ